MIKRAVLAGGCFWGLEDLLREQKGVVSTTAGYTGGSTQNPTYDNVALQSTIARHDFAKSHAAPRWRRRCADPSVIAPAPTAATAPAREQSRPTSSSANRT